MSRAAFLLLAFLWGNSTVISVIKEHREQRGLGEITEDLSSSQAGVLWESCEILSVSPSENVWFIMKSPSADCSFLCLTIWQWPSFRWQILCCSTACSAVLVLAFHWFSTDFESCHVLEPPGTVVWTCASTRIWFFPRAVLLSWFCLWRLWLKSLPSSLWALAGWHVPRDVIASKVVKIKSLGGGGVKAACVHTVWNPKLFPSPLHTLTFVCGFTQSVYQPLLICHYWYF